MTQIFLTTTGSGTWVVPSDWNNSANTIEVIGGGGGGRKSVSDGHIGTGGGGGAYSKATNVTLTPSSTVNIFVGAGGAAATGVGASGGAGGDTYLCSDQTGNCSDTSGTFGSSVKAGAHGGAGATTTVGGAGGSVTGAVGSVTSAGGAGGNVGNDFTGGAGGGGAGGVGSGLTGKAGGLPGASANGGSGGGGAGGTSSTSGSNAASGNIGGAGGNGPTGTGSGAGGTTGVAGTAGTAGTGAGGGGGGGASGANNVGNGGAGGSGSEWDSTHGAGGGGGAGGGSSTNTSGTDVAGAGGLYGGGGGGGGWQDGLGGAGAQGIIVITYTPVVTGIAFDAASNSGDQAASANYTFNRTVTGTNTFLTVDIELLTATGATVTSVTDDDGGGNRPLTFIGAQSTVTGAGRVECWGLVNPTTGTKSIRVILSASIESVATAVSYTGVHQTSPTEAFNSNQATNAGSATDASVVITTASNNCWIHAACVANDTSITANQTSRNNVAGTLGSGANEDNNAAVTPAGATTMSYSGMGVTTTWAIAGYAIRPTTDAALGAFLMLLGVGT